MSAEEREIEINFVRENGRDRVESTLGGVTLILDTDNALSEDEFAEDVTSLVTALPSILEAVAAELEGEQ